MARLDQCPCSGTTLARLIQPAVMGVLATEPLHGYVIVRRLAGMAMFRGQGPDATGVYRLLKSMERRRLVSSNWEIAARGPAKRRYQLTPAGRSCLKRWVATLRVYREAIADLLDRATPKATADARRVGGARQVRRKATAHE